MVTPDCDCACPVAPAPLRPQPLPQAALQPHRELRRIELDAPHAVAFVPSFSRVAVVNAATWALLQHPSAYHADPAASTTLANAYALGLLTTADAQPGAPPPSEALVAWLHVTNACNLRCSYCYIVKNGETMSLEVGQQAIEASFRSARAAGYRRVELKYAGGEATLSLRRVAELHQYALARAAELDLSVAGRVLSNGTTLTARRLELIASLGLGLMVSLDGLGVEHDAQRPMLGGQPSAAAALAGLRRALAYGLQPTVSITVTPTSISGLPVLIEALLAMGVHFTLSFVRPTEGTPDLIAAAEEQIIAGMRAAYAVIATRPPRHSLLGALLDRTNLGASHQRTCGVGENYLVFDQHGNVAKCQMLIDAPVTTVAAPDPLALIRADQIGVRNLPVEEKEGCRSCEWRYWCAGGCAVVTHQASGRYDVRSPNCRIYKALYPDVLRLEGQRLLATQANPAR